MWLQGQLRQLKCEGLWLDTTLTRPCTTVPCNNLTQCSCCPCNKWPWSSCCPCTSCSNVQVLPVTSAPKTHVVRAQVDPIFASTALNWAGDNVVRTQVAPVFLGSKKPRFKMWVNLNTDNMFTEHLSTVNLWKGNMCANYLSQKTFNIKTTCAWDITSLGLQVTQITWTF